MQQTASHTQLKQLLIGSLIASLCVAAVVAIAAIVVDAEISETTARMLGTVAALTVYSLTGLASNSLRSRRQELRWLGDVGLLSSLAGFGLAVVAIWGGDDSEASWKATAVSLTITLALAHSALLLRAPTDRLGEAAYGVRVAAVTTTSVLAGLLVFQTLTEGETLDWRVIAIVAVLFLLANVLLPLVRLLEPKR